MEYSVRTWQDEWNSCEKCEIGKLAIRKAIWRSSKHESFDFLFVGRSPGESENVTGNPFDGLTGKVLIDYLDSKNMRYCCTNLIGCKPQDKKGGRIRQPEVAEINNCKPRIVQLLEIVKPKMVIAVGPSVRDEILDLIPKEIRFAYIPNPSLKESDISTMKKRLIEAFRVIDR